MEPCRVCGASRIDLTCDSHADLLGKLKQWLLRITSNSHEGPRERVRFFTAALTNGATEASSIGWERIANARHGPFRARGGGCARVVVPTYQQYGVLRKAVRGPATCSGLRQRRQLIRGGRAQERANQRPRGTCAVSTTVRFAYGLRFLIDADADPDGFQQNCGRHPTMSATVDICTPTPFRWCGTSWPRLTSV